jgi:cytochrome c oxidase subunit 2
MRAQMNAVPGMTTRMHLKPTITTDSMRLVTKNPAFDYILLCNKICGASHYNMQMALVVEPEGAYKAWLAQQKGFQTGGEAAPAQPATPADSTKATAVDTTATAAATNEPKKID